MNYEEISKTIEDKVSVLFEELRSGISEREDSRAFGAMIERRITQNWPSICDELGYEALEIPGRRTIFDFACRVDKQLFGFDVKTKDLDTTSYSDGGVCAVGNLLKYMANDKGIFVIAEFGHNKSGTKNESRDIEYIRIAPFHCLPSNCYRIENLGTDEVILLYSLNQVWDEIDWDYPLEKFIENFSTRVSIHQDRVLQL